MPPARDVYQLTVHGEVAGQDTVNVFHFMERTGAPGASGVHLAQDWRTNILPTWRQMFAQAYTLGRIQGRRIWPTNDSIHDEIIAPPSVGSFANAAYLPGVAWVVSWKSPVAGRSHRGRTYLGGLPTNCYSNGVWSEQSNPSVPAWAALMLTRYGVGTTVQSVYDFGIFSRPTPARTIPKKVGGVWQLVQIPAYDGQFTAVTGYVSNLLARSQRRRNIGIGG